MTEAEKEKENAAVRIPERRGDRGGLQGRSRTSSNRRSTRPSSPLGRAGRRPELRRRAAGGDPAPAGRPGAAGRRPSPARSRRASAQAPGLSGPMPDAPSVACGRPAGDPDSRRSSENRIIADRSSERRRDDHGPSQGIPPAVHQVSLLDLARRRGPVRDHRLLPGLWSGPGDGRRRPTTITSAAQGREAVSRRRASPTSSTSPSSRRRPRS